MRAGAGGLSRPDRWFRTPHHAERGRRRPSAAVYSALVTVDPDIPRRVAQVGHDIDDLYALQTSANNSLSQLTGRQRRLENRVEEVLQTLDLQGGRLDRIEDNQRRQFQQLDGLAEQLAQVLTALRGPSSGD